MRIFVKENDQCLIGQFASRTQILNDCDATSSEGCKSLAASLLLNRQVPTHSAHYPTHYMVRRLEGLCIGVWRPVITTIAE